MKNKSFDLMQEVIIRSIKIVDIGYIFTLYILLAIPSAKIVDLLLGEFDPEKEQEKSVVRSILEILAIFWCLGILTYIARNIVEAIPFPLDGICGFDHSRMSELSKVSIFIIIFLTFQEHYKAKIAYIYNKLYPKKKTKPEEVEAS